MCKECGCGIYTPRAQPKAPKAPDTEVIVRESLHRANDAVAAQNRTLFREHGVLALNLMSSPGAGKTFLLEVLIPKLAPDLRCAVIVGDL